MRRLLLLGFLVLTLPAAAQPHPGARSGALGQANSALARDAWGGNPASWAGLERHAVGFYAAQLYGMPELRYGATVATLTALGGTVAAGARTFGFALYRQTVVSAGYARDVRPGTIRPIHLGLRLDAYSIRVPDIVHSRAVALSIGVVLPVAPLAAVGAVAEHVLVRGPARTDIPRSLILGFRYGRIDRVMIVADVHKELRSPADLRAGIEISPLPILVLRAGMSTNPHRATAGLGMRIGALTADFVAARHFALGWTPSASMQVSW